MSQLPVSGFADGADLTRMIDMGKLPYVKGSTTNPTLMNEKGVRDYAAVAKAPLPPFPIDPMAYDRPLTGW